VTLKSYRTVLVDLLALMAKSLDNTEEDYKLPLNDSQVELTKMLHAALHLEDQDLSLLHKLFYSFMAPPPDDLPFKKWDDPLLCWLAVVNLHEDGTFYPAQKLTGELARWEYLMCGTGLYESVTNTTGFGTLVESDFHQDSI
jgi:hypothetical protein